MEFVTLMTFDDWTAVESFAGPDQTASVVPPQGAALARAFRPAFPALRGDRPAPIRRLMRMQRRLWYGFGTGDPRRSPETLCQSGDLVLVPHMPR